MRTLLIGACLLSLAVSAQAQVTGGYRPGKGFSWETADGASSIAIYGQLQLRYTHVSKDDSALEDVSDFDTRRIRLYVGGKILEDWKYKVQTAFEGDSAELKDAVVTYARYPGAQLSLGQLKPTLDWQEKTSSSKQMFVDRSLATRAFGSDRDIGLQLHGEAAAGKFEYAVGWWDRAVDDNLRRDDGAKLTARISFQPNGPFGYSESDLERTEQHLWFLNFSARFDDDILGDEKVEIDGMDETVGTLTDVTTYNAGIGYRHRGVYLQGEYFWRESDWLPSLSDVSEMPDSETDVDMNAGYFQLGYAFPGSRWDVGVRYSKLDPDEDTHDDTRSATMLGVNRYLRGLGHALKVSGDLALLEEEVPASDSLDDVRLRVQLQLKF